MKLSIPDAAAELGVSETRLRKTLTEIEAPTQAEYRKTRTGVRKTTVLGTDAIELLRDHFEAPPSYIENAAQQSAILGERNCFHGSLVREAKEDCPAHAYRAVAMEDAEDECEAGGPLALVSRQDFAIQQQEVAQPLSSSSGQSVPAAQFNALLYQHNVLREELARVSDYLEGCDHLLGEMVRTISTLEERTRQLERAPGSARGRSNPLSGALRSLSSSVQNALFSRASRAMPKPAEVYYGSVLAGR